HPGHSSEHGLDAAAPRAPRVLRAGGEISAGEPKGSRDGGDEMSARDDSPPTDAAEPRRLLEEPRVHETDASAAWALDLLRGAEPYRTPAGRKQRVQLRLGHTPRRRAPLVLRLAVAAIVLFGGAAVVSAAMGHWPQWAARAYERVVGRPPAATARARTHAARHVEARRAPPPPAPSVAEDVPWPEIPL